MATTSQGALVLADISGYTQYLSETELEHSREILSELLNTVVSSLEGRLAVSNLEGDAVFFIGVGLRGDLLGPLEETFVAFHRRMRDMVNGTTCQCAACRNIGNLNLKFAVHHGTFSTQRIGNTEQVIGSDVILVHRLLKNAVPSHEYVLATRPAIEAFGIRPATLVEHSEEYEHVGVVEGGYADLKPVWDWAQSTERKRVEPQEARVFRETVVPAPISTVWKVITTPDLRAYWMGQPRVTVRPGARGTIQGAEYHCHHGRNSVSVFRVVNAIEGREFSENQGSFMGLEEMFCSIYLDELEPGKTRVRIAVTWAEPRTFKARLASAMMVQMMRRKFRTGGIRIAELSAAAIEDPSRVAAAPACSFDGAAPAR